MEQDRFVKIFGNHDLYWGNDPLAAVSLLQIYGVPSAFTRGQYYKP
jgi:hypothetical protein